MAVAIGARPSVFFSSTDVKEIQVLHTGVPESKGSKGERQASYECKRGLLALAAHPSDASILFQLSDDSIVSVVALRSGQRNLELLWAAPLRSDAIPSRQVCLWGHLHL